LSRLGAAGRLVAFDKDPEALAAAATRYQTQSEADGTPMSYAHAVSHVANSGRR
jgi:16S rRNA C1402 N4-methylase RsmH